MFTTTVFGILCYLANECVQSTIIHQVRFVTRDLLQMYNEYLLLCLFFLILLYLTDVYIQFRGSMITTHVQFKSFNQLHMDADAAILSASRVNMSEAQNSKEFSRQCGHGNNTCSS